MPNMRSRVDDLGGYAYAGITYLDFSHVTEAQGKKQLQRFHPNEHSNLIDCNLEPRHLSSKNRDGQ